MSKIDLRDISIARGKKKLISNFNFKFNSGKLYTIVGKSGIGKSTLLSILGLLSKEYEGTLFIDGINTKK